MRFQLQETAAHSFSGAEARSEAPTNDRPYRETFAYDALGHLTNRSSNNWSDFLLFMEKLRRVLTLFNTFTNHPILS